MYIFVKIYNFLNIYNYVINKILTLKTKSNIKSVNKYFIIFSLKYMHIRIKNKHAIFIEFNVTCTTLAQPLHL